jgi:hypothetical protein
MAEGAAFSLAATSLVEGAAVAEAVAFALTPVAKVRKWLMLLLLLWLMLLWL